MCMVKEIILYRGSLNKVSVHYLAPWRVSEVRYMVLFLHKLGFLCSFRGEYIT